MTKREDKKGIQRAVFGQGCFLADLGGILEVVEANSHAEQGIAAGSAFKGRARAYR